MPTNVFRRGEWTRAGVTLAGALVLAAASERLYVHGQAGAGLAAALAALYLCGRVLVLSAKRLIGGISPRRVRLPFAAPLTIRGAAFAAMLALVGLTAAYSGNNLIYLTFSAMAAALAVSGLVSRLNAANLNLRVGLPDRLFAGQTSTVRVAVSSTKRRMTSYSLRVSASDPAQFEMESVYLPAIGPGERVAMAARATFPRRGPVRGAGVVLSSAFPFGFSERRLELVLSSELVVYPSVEFTEQAREVLRRFEDASASRALGDSQDLYRIRPARYGDSARFLDWKAAARGGGLWVREYAREDRRRAAIAFDRRVGAGEPAEEFEKRVALAAAVVWRLAEWRSEIAFASDEAVFRCERESGAVFEILRYLALVRPTEDAAAAPMEPMADGDEAATRLSIAAGAAEGA